MKWDHLQIHQACLFIHSFNLSNNEVIFNSLEGGMPAEVHTGWRDQSQQ